MFDQDVLFCSVSREEKRITSYFVINIPIRHSFQREIQDSKPRIFLMDMQLEAAAAVKSTIDVLRLKKNFGLSKWKNNFPVKDYIIYGGGLLS